MLADFHSLNEFIRPKVYDLFFWSGRAHLPADNQRGAGFIDKYIICFIHQGIVVAPLHITCLAGCGAIGPMGPKRCIGSLALCGFKTVPQKVKTKLTGSSVGDITLISLNSLCIWHLLLKHTGGHAQKFKYWL